MAKTCRYRGKFIWFLAAIVFVVPLFIFISPGKPSSDLKKTTFLMLERHRIEKKQQITRYFDNIRQLASTIQTDENMLRFFGEFKKNGSMEDQNLQYELDKYAILNYGDFYDILFVDTFGLIFHSLRKESDYRKNIFKGPLANTRLAAGIEQKLKESFVEYEFYAPSGEAAAFFAVPLFESNKQLGWIVLQCAINRVNMILTDRRSLGRTGEVYLVNNNKLMLSDSRFLEDSTILKLKVDTDAVKNAIQNNSGESIIKDYRGISVFSSFEKFDLFGTSWIIITEIDEDEVITDYYKKYKKYFNNEITRYLAGHTRKNLILQLKVSNAKRIDINEFTKAGPGELIQTFGIATCTGVAMLFKNEFCYLSHISPTDKIYKNDSATNIFSKRISSDFLGELIQKVKYFDLYPYELRNLNFVIIAPHCNSFSRTVDIIINNGIELSSIKFMYNPGARCANVTVSISQNAVIVKWVSDRLEIMESSSGVEDLSTILKKIIKYDV